MYGKYKAGEGGVLGDDMGLGKTVQSIALVSAVLEKTGENSRYSGFIFSFSHNNQPIKINQRGKNSSSVALYYYKHYLYTSMYILGIERYHDKWH